MPSLTTETVEEHSYGFAKRRANGARKVIAGLVPYVLQYDLEICVFWVLECKSQYYFRFFFLYRFIGQSCEPDTSLTGPGNKVLPFVWKHGARKSHFA